MSTSALADTIVAPITAVPGAVAIVRLSGPSAFEIARAVFSPFPADPTPRLAVLGRLSTGDEGFALPFPTGQSYTGEQTVEISMHGSKASVDALIPACLEAGARYAKPGEFTQRAFLNGRLDLTQAEAVRETIESETSAQLQSAERNRSGALNRAVQSVQEPMLGLLAQLEACIDFSEEVGDLDRPSFADECRNVAARVEQIQVEGSRLRIAREGLRVALVGLPNSGKSSLMNALLGHARSIVTDIPGTTRDYVEEVADFIGVRVVLVDTAGLRETDDPIEAIGVQRTLAQAAQADEIWYLYDAAQGWTDADSQATRDLNARLILANKCDLARGPHGIPISTLTGEGIDRLVELVAERAQVDAPYYVSDRHAPLLERAKNSLRDAGKQAMGHAPEDLLAVLIRDALATLGEITGETASSDLLESIFSRFCIGK